MKIAVVAFVDFDQYSAAKSRVQLLARGLALRGHEVHVVLPIRYTSGPLYTVSEGLHVHWGISVRTDSIARSRLEGRLGLLLLVKRLCAARLDWLVLYNMGIEGVLMLAIASAYGVKVASEYCDVWSPPLAPNVYKWTRYLSHELGMKLISRHANLNIVISKFIEAKVTQIAPTRKTILIPQLVDCEKFRYDQSAALLCRNKWKIGSDFIIAYILSHYHYNGLRLLMSACALLASEGESFKLLISGAPSSYGECDDAVELVSYYNLSDRTILTGWIPLDEVIPTMCAANCLVLPKLNHIANLAAGPTVLAEYLAMGRPIVATRVGDISMYVHDEEDVLLCEPEIVSLANQIRRIIHDHALRQTLEFNARNAALKHFDYRIAGELLDLSLSQSLSIGPEIPGI